MNRLIDLYSEEVLKRLERKLGPDLLEQILDTHDARSLGEVSAENGWFAVIAVIDNPKHSEFIKDAVAAGMNVDPDHVDVDDSEGQLQATGEMCCGSQHMPWPEYALRTLEQVNKILSSASKKPAGLIF